MAPTTSCAACRCSATLLAWSVDGELQLGVLSAPAARRALVRAAGRRGLGRRAGGARAAAPVRCRAVARVADAQLLYGSRRDIEASRRRAGLPTRLSARPGASAASATSGATRSSPRAPRRRWSRSACTPGTSRPRWSWSRRPAAGSPTSRARRIDRRRPSSHRTGCSTTRSWRGSADRAVGGGGGAAGPGRDASRPGHPARGRSTAAAQDGLCPAQRRRGPPHCPARWRADPVAGRRSGRSSPSESHFGDLPGSLAYRQPQTRPAGSSRVG